MPTDPHDTAICLKTNCFLVIMSFINILYVTLRFQLLSHDAKRESSEEFIDCFEHVPLQELIAESRSQVGGTCIFHDLILHLNDKISNSFGKSINK